jgi:AbiU2
MKINISDSADFKRLLEALVDELIDARDHFRLRQGLANAIPDYSVEFNQSPGFWTMTLTAHMDATLLRLCKAYDLYDGKPSLNLRNFLETIEANLHLFDEPNFRERLKENAFVDSLAAHPRKPDPTQLHKDLESVNKSNPLVKKLTIWRNNYLAHRSRTSALSAKGFAEDNPILFSEIEALIDNGLRIVNYYSDLFSATHYASLAADDYKQILEAVRRDLDARERRIQEEVAAINARAPRKRRSTTSS